MMRSQSGMKSPDGVEIAVSEDEQGPLVFASEDKVDRSVGNINDPDLLAIGPVDVDLACGQKDVPGAVLDDAIASLLGE